MPPFPLTDAQVADLAEFLHSFLVSSRTGPSTIDILVGDAEKGEAYVVAKCASCHTTAALTAFADKLDGSEDAAADVDHARQRRRPRWRPRAHSGAPDSR